MAESSACLVDVELRLTPSDARHLACQTRCWNRASDPRGKYSLAESSACLVDVELRLTPFDAR